MSSRPIQPAVFSRPLSASLRYARAMRRMKALGITVAIALVATFVALMLVALIGALS